MLCKGSRVQYNLMERPAGYTFDFGSTGTGRITPLSTRVKGYGLGLRVKGYGLGLRVKG